MNLLEAIRHYTNPLHLYCRLVDGGFDRPLAKRVSAAWECIYTRPRMALIALVATLLMVACASPALAKRLHPERVYQDRWCDERAGRREVRLPGRLRADCLTESHAVEVDFADKWPEAVGQCLAYASAAGKRAGILLILEHPGDDRHLSTLLRVIRGNALPIDVWTITPEPRQ